MGRIEYYLQSIRAFNFDKRYVWSKQIDGVNVYFKSESSLNILESCCQTRTQNTEKLQNYQGKYHPSKEKIAIKS